MPYINIWIHTIWSTKNRYPYLNKKIRPQIFAHIRENAERKKIHLDFINGHNEHVHALISLNAEQNIAQVAKLLKGESSSWINKQKLTSTHFNWQDEYMAVSVSYSVVNKVRDYIKNQEEHHRKMTFKEEYDLFIKKYGFQVILNTGD